MKIKALAITSIFVAAGALQGQAQDNAFSANAVGYVKKTFSPGFTLFANPLEAENNTIASLLAAAPGGSVVYKFDSQSGFQAITNVDPIGWLDTTTTLVPGEGAFIFIPDGGDYNATFVGQVKQGDLSTEFPSGFSLASSQVPQAGLISADLGLDPASVSAVYKFDTGTQSYSAFASIPGVGFLPGQEPSVGIGESVFLESASGGSWDRTFSVSE